MYNGLERSACLICRYYTKEEGHQYFRCYMGSCPAYRRDNVKQKNYLTTSPKGAIVRQQYKIGDI